jgi:hypothetical protein
MNFTILTPNASHTATVNLPARLDVPEVREALAIVWRQLVEQVPDRRQDVRRAKRTVKRAVSYGFPTC